MRLFPRARRWPSPLPPRCVGGPSRGTNRCAEPEPRSAQRPAPARPDCPPQSRFYARGGSLESLAVVLNVNPAAGFFQPLLHLFVGRLADEGLLDAGAMVVYGRRLPGMRLHQLRAHVLVEVLANLFVGDLDSGPEAQTNETHQHQLPREARLQFFFIHSIRGQRAAIRGVVPIAD